MVIKRNSPVNDRRCYFVIIDWTISLYFPNLSSPYIWTGLNCWELWLCIFFWWMFQFICAFCCFGTFRELFAGGAECFALFTITEHAKVQEFNEKDFRL